MDDNTSIQYRIRMAQINALKPSSAKKINEDLEIGQKVRVTNPNATPRYEIVGKDERNYHLIRPEDGKSLTLPKDRIHHVNNTVSKNYDNEMSKNHADDSDNYSNMSNVDVEKSNLPAYDNDTLPPYDSEWNRPEDFEVVDKPEPLNVDVHDNWDLPDPHPNPYELRRHMDDQLYNTSIQHRLRMNQMKESEENPSNAGFKHSKKNLTTEASEYPSPKSHMIAIKQVGLWNDKDGIIKRALKDENPEIRKFALERATGHNNINVRISAARHPETPDHIVKQFLSDDSLDVRHAAIDRSLDHPDVKVRLNAIRHIDATPKHIDKALEDKEENVKIAGVLHPNANEKHVTKAMDDSNPKVGRAAMTSEKVNSKHITKALNDPDEELRVLAVRHPNVEEKHIKMALNDESERVRNMARKSEKYVAPDQNTQTELDLRDPDPTVRLTAIRNVFKD